MMNIWWIRNDLRLEDNPALTAAMRAGYSVLPVFILDDLLLNKPAEKRQAFLFSGLQKLRESLLRLGSGLIIRRGDPRVELPQLMAESGATSIYAEADVSPYAWRRDSDIALQVDLHLVHGRGFYPPEAVKKPDGQSYSIYSPYSRAWKALPFSDQVHPAPSALNPIPDIAGVNIPDALVPGDFLPGETEAQHRLSTFLDGPIYAYRETRDRMDLDGTSRLSPYLRFGMISIRQVVISAVQAITEAPGLLARTSAEIWLGELIWRDFFQAILYQNPFVLKLPFKSTMRAIPWRDAPSDLSAWQCGQTGYPVVDAAMRQLVNTGWMHNRARMIVASFLVKHLLVNWQSGERWFMQQLVDGDPASNNGGWQWVAGVGVDAAPYFRIFNPTLQGKKFDPHGDYIHRWVPELIAVPEQHIHAPWLMTDAEQRKVGVIIGRDYPAPIVSHDFARARALATYKGQIF